MGKKACVVSACITIGTWARFQHVFSQMISKKPMIEVWRTSSERIKIEDDGGKTEPMAIVLMKQQGLAEFVKSFYLLSNEMYCY